MSRGAIRDQLADAARAMTPKLRLQFNAFLADLAPKPKPRKVHSWKRKGFKKSAKKTVAGKSFNDSRKRKVKTLPLFDGQ